MLCISVVVQVAPKAVQDAPVLLADPGGPGRSRLLQANRLILVWLNHTPSMALRVVVVAGLACPLWRLGRQPESEISYNESSSPIKATHIFSTIRSLVSPLYPMMIFRLLFALKGHVDPLYPRHYQFEKSVLVAEKLWMELFSIRIPFAPYESLFNAIMVCSFMI